MVMGTGAANPQGPYEYVRIEGRRAHVCATPTCRLPLQVLKAHNPLFPVPEVGDPVPYKKQAVCGPCYRAQYELVYPGKELPEIADAIIEGYGPIPKDWKEANEPVDDDYAIWEMALEQSRASDGAETVVQAYKRLLSEPEIIIDGPPVLPDPTTVDVIAVRE